MKNEIRVVVESKKVPSRIVQVKYSSHAGSLGLLPVSVTRSVIIYDYELDEEQSKVLDEARKLSDSSGACLKIVDLARVSGIRRVVRRIIGGGSQVPLVTIVGPVMEQLLSLHPGQPVSRLPVPQAGEL